MQEKLYPASSHFFFGIYNLSVFKILGLTEIYRPFIPIIHFTNDKMKVQR